VPLGIDEKALELASRLAIPFRQYPMFRISKDTNTVIDAARVDQLEPAIRSSKPGLDEISAGPLAPGHTSRCWSVGIKKRDVSNTIERDPWEA
jgi:hypothetical protein